MKKIVLPAVAVLLTAMFMLTAFTRSAAPAGQTLVEGVRWYTWEEAVAANKTAPKNFFVDVYTDWCGWCKTMDRETFSKAEIAEYLNTNYYPVKLNAEQRADIVFGVDTFRYVQPEGRGKGVHQLAYSLLDGKMGYPTVVYLSPNFERVMIAPGYKTPADLMPQLQYVAGKHYLTLSWDDYIKKGAVDKQ